MLKNESIWKYKIVLTYPPKYVLLKGYPRLLKEEYPDIPFRSVDSAFSIASSIFFFKGKFKKKTKIESFFLNNFILTNFYVIE